MYAPATFPSGSFHAVPTFAFGTTAVAFETKAVAFETAFAAFLIGVRRGAGIRAGRYLPALAWIGRAPTVVPALRPTFPPNPVGHCGWDGEGTRVTASQTLKQMVENALRVGGIS